jgi:hypothetical protein
MCSTPITRRTERARAHGAFQESWHAPDPGETARCRYIAVREIRAHWVASERPSINVPAADLICPYRPKVLIFSEDDVDTSQPLAAATGALSSG